MIYMYQCDVVQNI